MNQKTKEGMDMSFQENKHVLKFDSGDDCTILSDDYTKNQ